jgi:membrane protein
MVAFFLGLLGFWPTYGPSIILALFLIAAGPVIAFGKRANVEATGLRTLAIMAAVACGLVFSGFLNAGLIQSPEDAGAGATGGFMFFAALEMWAIIRQMQRSVPELVEGLDMKIALSAAAAAGSFGFYGVLALALFCAAGSIASLWFRAKGWRVDITGLFASCALVLLSLLALVPWLFR